MDTNIYENGGLSASTMSKDQVYDLMKAMSAGSQTGRDLDGQNTSGSALKTESLDPTLKIITNTNKHIVFWKMLPKEKAYNTVEEYNQLVDYGLDIGITNNEGETPQFTDSIYRRESVLIKYLGVSGEVTHPFTIVNLGSGVGNALAKEVQNKTELLVRSIDKLLPTGDSATVGTEFDGIFKQHYVGVTGGTTVAWDSYFNDSTVIDNRGEALSDANVEDASNAVVNDNFGSVSTIMGAPRVFNDYVKRFHESKRVNVNAPNSATTGATMGQRVNTIATQFGDIDIANDIYFDYDKTQGFAYNKAATSSKSPAAPAATSIATVTDTNSTKFGDGAGDYFYAVAAKNRYGLSALQIMDTTAIAVAATESVDITVTQTDTAYAAESFVVYRTEKDVTDYTTAKFYPILTVSVAQKLAGYDGAAATKIRDRNRFLPNTNSAIVCEFTTDVMAFKQLAPMMRMDLARTSPSYRFMVMCYGTPVLYTPKKIARIINIGRTITT